MRFRCSGALVTLPADPADIRRAYRAYRHLLGLTPPAARRRLLFAYS